jgi:hypothetical protein
MNIYTGLFTNTKTIGRIKLEIVAIDYLKALESAHAYAVKNGYRFDDLVFKSKAPKNAIQ